jgi:glutamine amidotransferase-like uncharacterized protein
MVSALEKDYRFEIFGKDELLSSTFANADIVAFPGGIGDSDRYHDFFRRRGIDEVVKFVERGGKYLGICMGAYWAGRNYFDLLEHDVDAVQYIKRPTADIRRSFSTVANVDWADRQETMFFYDGCTFTGNTSNFKTIASYANNEPMAIIQGNLGLIGCHPESEEFWYDKPYLKDHWHHEWHHKLLLGFVNQLMQQ